MSVKGRESSMKFFFILSANKVKKALIIVIAAFFTAGFLYIQNQDHTVFSTKSGPKAIFKGADNNKNIALTFDISWGDEKAIPILDYLKKNNIHNATFFVSASWAEIHPEIVERIVEDGHEIGSMGYKYKNYSDWDPKKVQQDIIQSKEILEGLGVKKLKLLRPPNGDFNKEVLKIAESLGFTIVHWSVNSKDYTNPGTDAIVENVLSNINSGDIILLHASDSAKQTLKALPPILKGLKEKRLENVTISSLISNSATESEEVK
jgi:polysaccharide deacetylase family sporulation protein PdaB